MTTPQTIVRLDWDPFGAEFIEDRVPGEPNVSPQSKAAAHAVREYVRDAALEHRAQPRDDLLRVFQLTY